MTKNKNKITLLIDPDGNKFPLVVEDLIPIHSSSSEKKNADGALGKDDFDRAVALIWTTLMESSENSSVENTINVPKLWEPKQVSDA